MKSHYRLLILVLCSLAGLGFADKEDPLTLFLAKLTTYQETYLPEKVHIHTDKPYYSIGDTIWFKAYVVNADNNQLSNRSKILYVDLINEKDSIKRSLRLPVVAGLSWGDFILADSLTEGNYRVRGYTNWMRNFDEAYFFDKTIKIGNVLTHQIITNAQYQFSKNGTKEQVEARVSYTNLKGEPLKGKEVSYDVQLDSRNISKGNATTDSSGAIQIKFTNAQPFILKAGRINTILKVSPSSSVRKILPVKATSSDANVQFFPESGNLVSNVRSRVGFKVVGADGLGKNITGYISDDKSQKVAELKSEYAGMGSFAFTPLRNSSYRATLLFEDGSQKQYDLPKHNDQGYVLTVNHLEDDLAIKVTSGQNQGTTNELIVIGRSNRGVEYISKSALSADVLRARVPKKRFPTGIIQFTLFNSSYQPLAERLVFVRHKSPSAIQISTNKLTYKTREAVEMELTAVDTAKRPLVGSFSVAVIDEGQVPYNDVNESTILSNLLLSSDLKGYVETPNYYFEEPSLQKDKELDNLMLTQGWRRFEWTAVQSGSLPQLAFQPEKSIKLSGRVVDPNGRASVAAKVSLMSSLGTGLLLDTLTDAEGKFSFENLVFNDSTTFIVQAKSAKGKKNIDLQIDQLPPQIVTKSENAPMIEVNVNRSIKPYLDERHLQFEEMRKNGLLRRSIVLAEVKIVETKPKVKYSSNLNGAGNADNIIMGSELQNCTNLAFCLQGRVGGLIIQNGIAYLTRNMLSTFSAPIPVQIIVDATYVDPITLSLLNVNDIESIEILKGVTNTAIYGTRGVGGLMIITTKRGEPNFSPRRFSNGLASFAPQGFYVSRQFYSPKYDKPRATAMRDVRSTIFWAPNVVTDQAGQASVNFFTADKPGTYKVVLEGVDLNGSLARQVYRFKVGE